MKIPSILHLSTLAVLLPLTALAPLSGCAAETTAADTTAVETAPVAKTIAPVEVEADAGKAVEKPALPAPKTDETAKEKKPEMPDKTIVNADKGKTVNVKVGQRLLVKLGSNPTTGYEWSVAQTDDKLLPPDGDTTFDVPDTPTAGAPTVQTLFFKAKSAGKTKLELQYSRPWEKEKEPNKTYTVDVVIGKDATN